MPRIRLKNLRDWQLENEDQDIRGWMVVDEAGHKVGKVEDMIADTDREMIDAIVVEDGQEYSARDFDIEKDVVRLHVPATVPGTNESRTFGNPRLIKREKRSL